MMTNRARGLGTVRSLALSALFFGLVLSSPSAWANDEPGTPGASGAGAAPSPPSPPSTPTADRGTPSASSILSGGQGAPTPPLGKGGGSASKGFSGTVGGGAAFEALNGDYFLRLDLATALSFGPVKLGVSVPLRLRVIDNDPQNDGVFRSKDWDEVSDWARIIRFVEVNLGGDAWRFRGRFGSLDGESIGHGTIVGGYYNNIDANHYQAGLALNVAINYGGIEFMLDNLLRPEIFAFRVHVRPTSFFTDKRWANKLIVATSFAADARAPVALVDRTTPGDPPLATPDGVPDVDGQSNFVVDDRTTLGIWGLDVEYELLRNRIVDLVPYADLNLLFDDGAGVGFHLGLFFNVRIPIPIIKPVLLTRMEYRAIGEGYAPRYFDSIYEAQRYAYAPGVLVDSTDPNAMPRTKVGWLRTTNAGANGWLGELYFDFAGIVRIGGSFEDYTGPNNSALTLALLLPALKVVQAGAYFSNRGFDGISHAFDLENALMRAFVRARIYGPVYFTASYTRTWELQSDGDYVAQNNYGAGLDVAFSF